LKKISKQSVFYKQSDYFTGKIILQRGKEHCVIYIIHAHFMLGLRLGLGLS